MKTAILGTGGIAHTHAAALQALGQELTLVVGHTLSGAEQFARELHCPHFTDHLTPEALAEVDCVHVCTPPESHFEQVSLCLKAGKHVLCEKPLSLSPAEAVQLTGLAESSGSVCAVNFNNRFYPSAQRVRQQAAEMGRLLLVHGRYFQEFHRMPAAYSWRYREPLRAVSEIGSHLIDQLRFFTGLEVESVSAVFQNAFPHRVLRDGMLYPDGEGTPIEVASEDAAAVMLRLEGGALASVLLSEISPGRSNDLALELVSADRSISWCAEEPYSIVTGTQGALTVRKNAFSGGFTDTFTDCFAAFYRAVETGQRDPRLAAFRDAAINAVVVAAMAESARADGAWMDLRGEEK